MISLVRRGGILHHNIDLANSLSTINNVTVITSQDIPQGSFSNNVSHRQVYTGTKKLGTFINYFNPNSYKKIASIASKLEPNIVHITSPHEWNLPISWVISRLLKLPLALTIFDPIYHEGTPTYIRLPDYFSRRLPDGYIVLSKNLKRELVSRGFAEEEIFVSKDGPYSSFTRWKQDSIKEENIILFFGRIEHYKGLDLLLQSAEEILAPLSGWKIIVAGSGKLEPYKNMLRSNNIEVIHKFLEEKEAAQLIQRSKMLILPYRSATTSGIIPTACAFSKPVIATDVGSLGAIVEHEKTGILIPPNDPKSLVLAIHRLALNGDYRKTLGKNALSLSQRKLSWKTIAEEHTKHYTEVIKIHAMKK